MAIKQGHQTYSGSSSGMGSSSSAIIVLLILGIIIGLVVAGFFMMGQIADTSSEGIDVFVQISGNDVLITLISGGNVNQITDICVYVDGYTSPEKNIHLRNPPVGTPIQFAGLAAGVTGYTFVIVEATFTDGTETVIKYARMRFS
ncbi:MAG: hypothetical protein MJ014_00605 [Methanocorpusculum sp.]|nr:hypothetical protein [Methanocorpusculum sp.]